MATAKKLAFAKPAAPPFTAITTNVVTVEQLTAQVQQTMEQNAALLQAYHRLWYESTAHTWGFTGYLGIGLMKCPNDLWVYQDIITRLRPKTILEMGTFAGGSALWFAHLMDLNGIEDGEVHSVDIDASHRDPRAAHPRITFWEGSSVERHMALKLVTQAQHPLLVVLDSDHSEAHVRKELDIYAPLCQSGDRLVVEDTNVAWPNDRGARGALDDYLVAHPGEWVHDILCERYLLTMHPDGWLVEAMTDLHVNVGEWRMQPVEFNLQRMFVSGRLYRYAYGDEIKEVFEPVAIGLTNGQAAVLVARKYGPVPRIL